MFHQYVLNAHSVPIDIDRAVFLMDKKLWLKVCTKYHETGQTDPQWAYEEYREQHK